MVYTDGVHLVADTMEELHRFARCVGLRRNWFQAHVKHPHYDITSPRLMARAFELGASRVRPRVALAVAQRLR